MKTHFRLFSFPIILAALVLLASAGCDNRPTLSFYTWADYIDPDLVTEFEAKYKCKVEFDYYNSNEAMYAKLRSGKVAYDVVLPTTYTVDIMTQKNMLQKMDVSKMPNAVKYIAKDITKKLNDENMEFSVPYMLTFPGVGYNVKHVGEAPKSWDIFADERFKGRMTMLDDKRQVLAAGLMHLGYSINTRDEEELAKARDLVISWKKNLAKFGVDDTKQSLKNGEFYIVHAYSGDIMQMTLDDSNIQFAMPGDHVILLVDHFVIPKNAKNVELAHAFIDFLCEPSNAARNMEFTQYLAPNREALKLLPAELRDKEVFQMSGDILDKAEMPEYMESVSDQDKYTKAWDDIRAAK